MNLSAAPDRFQRAVQLHGQGRIGDAEALCRDILRAEPSHAGALHLLGVGALQVGQLESAVDLLRKSLASNPQQPFGHTNLAAGLLRMQRFEAALAACDDAVRLAPNFPQAHYNRGTALLELQRPVEALAAFDRTVQLQPNSVMALHNRGSILAKLNRLAEALESYDAALRLKPDLVGTLNNRGNVLDVLGRHAEALESYARALRLQPDFPEALNNRANALRLLNRHAEALESYDRALHLRRDFADAWNGRGRALQGLKRPIEALESYEHALRLRPNFTEALNNQGSVLWELKRFDESLVSFDRTLELDPGQPEALYNRSNVLRDLRRCTEALDSSERALLVRPDFVEALSARGSALMALKRSPEALDAYDAALRLRPDFTEVLHNRGNALRSLGRLEEALESFDRALQLGERRPEALANYAWTLLDLRRYDAAAKCFEKVLEVDPDASYVLGALHYARSLCCDWAEYQQTVDRISALVRADRLASVPFPLMATSDTPDLHLRCAQLCAADRCPASSSPAWHGQRYAHERIRVAYVSADLRDHVVSRLMAPLIEGHDREQFEIIGVSVRPPEDTPFGRRIRAAFDRFHDVTLMSDQQIAALLCEQEVDIAVDLGGFTGDQRPGIFAHRGAPVQVNYLGYPGTMGADYFHYILADATVIPEETRAYYSEKVVYLPDCYQANHAERAPSDPTLSRAQHGLPETGLVLCSFNNSFKLTPAVFDIWVRVLQAIEGSVLWLAGHRPSVAQNLRALAVARGVAPERLIFAEQLPNVEDHLARYALAEIFLDTFPFNAHATASDALWHAVPVVTCQGRAFAGRVAASLLQVVGLPELITHDLQEYEAKILELASTPALLAQVRERLARNRASCALFDTARFRGHLEAAYRIMWERQQRGEPPEHFAVPVEHSRRDDPRGPAAPHALQDLPT